MLLLLLTACTAPVDDRPRILAAASTEPALREVLADAPRPAVVSAASTSTLVRQLEAGADAALLLSAHPDWTARVAEARPEVTVEPLLATHLVLAGPEGSSPTLTDLDAPRCVVVGDPDHVPLGLWTREALTTLGRWDALAGRLVPTLDAAAAAAALAAGACPVGVLYATDATRPGVVAGPPLPAHAQPTLGIDLLVLDPAAADLAEHLREHPAWARAGFVSP